jgi:hypothetical protein
MPPSNRQLLSQPHGNLLGFATPLLPKIGSVRLYMATFEAAGGDCIVGEFNFMSGQSYVHLNPSCDHHDTVCLSGPPPAKRVGLASDGRNLCLSFRSAGTGTLSGQIELIIDPSGNASLRGDLDEIPFLEAWQYRRGTAAPVFIRSETSAITI